MRHEIQGMGSYDNNPEEVKYIQISISENESKQFTQWKKNVYQLIFTQECRCFIFSLQIKLQKKPSSQMLKQQKKILIKENTKNENKKRKKPKA